MALDAQSQAALNKFTLAARTVIYSKGAMTHFMKMLGSPQGAIAAAQSVLSVIEKTRKIPPNIMPLLAVNCYLIMVDVAQAATKIKPDAGVMKQVITALLQAVSPIQAPQQTQQTQQPQGILSGAMGATA